MTIILGEIYQSNLDNSIVRVIGFDEYEVFYDRYWEDDNSWTFSSNLKKKCSFFRIPVDVFLNEYLRIDFKALTEIEKKTFRPDITIRTCRIKNLSWTEQNLLDKIKESRSNFQLIKTNKIWLYPFGSKGGLKKGELIEAKNKNEFSANELFINASRLQKEVNKNQTNGIGIYRIGIQKQIPSYYIGEYYDLAGIMKRIETA